MISINISRDDEYHTQLNNRFFPHGACNTTSEINALRSSGVDFDSPFHLQPEDYLTQILESEDAWAKMKREFPWAIRDGYHPRHVHKMLEWAVNTKLVGRDVSFFTESVSLQKIIFHLVKNRQAVIMSGRFTKFGHIVCLVGLETDQSDIEQIEGPPLVSLASIKNFIIDDPYGDWHTGYQSQKGNNVRFSYTEYNALTTVYDNAFQKRAHLFDRHGWTTKKKAFYQS